MFGMSVGKGDENPMDYSTHISLKVKTWDGNEVETFRPSKRRRPSADLQEGPTAQPPATYNFMKAAAVLDSFGKPLLKEALAAEEEVTEMDIFIKQLKIAAEKEVAENEIVIEQMHLKTKELQRMNASHPEEGAFLAEEPAQSQIDRTRFKEEIAPVREELRTQSLGYQLQREMRIPKVKTLV